MTSLHEIRPKEEDISELTPDMEEELKEKEVSSQKLRVYDSDLEESDSIPGRHNGHNSKVCHCIVLSHIVKFFNNDKDY